jgi:FKBP12-rapamycin complex-associated protein
VTPVDVIHRVLDLAEYMEREHKALPIDPEVLGNAALAISSWAQALHYKELDYFKDSTAEVIESLLTINASLRERDAAFGTLHIAREQYDVRMHETWYEKLGKWQEALTVYESKLDHDSPFVQLGKIRCLHALQEWEELATVIDDAWEVSSNEQKSRIAPMAAATAWSLSEWDAMEDYVRHIPPKSLDHAYYCAVLSIHRSQRDSALQQLAKARDLLVPMFEGYDQDGVPYEYVFIIELHQHRDQPFLEP